VAGYCYLVVIFFRGACGLFEFIYFDVFGKKMPSSPTPVSSGGERDFSNALRKRASMESVEGFSLRSGCVAQLKGHVSF
jgi:hypothetical protein